VPHEAKAVAVQLKLAGVRAAVVDAHAPRIGLAAGARVAAAWSGNNGEDRRAVVDNVIERRFDGIRGGIEFCSQGHLPSPVEPVVP
jgi:hypothetical protein